MKTPKYIKKFKAAKVGMRCSIWQTTIRKYGHIIQKKYHGHSNSTLKKRSYIRIKFEDGYTRKFNLLTLGIYSSFRLELSGLDKAAMKAAGVDYTELTRGGRETNSI